MRDFVHNPKRVHAFVSAWHRTADEEQRDELKEHNLTVFSITSQANVDKFNKWLDGALAEGKEIVIHMDECDHGSGSNQTLSKIWYKIRMSDRITTIMYSATRPSFYGHRRMARGPPGNRPPALSLGPIF